jgi:hypothetical protein
VDLVERLYSYVPTVYVACTYQRSNHFLPSLGTLSLLLKLSLGHIVLKEVTTGYAESAGNVLMFYRMPR